MHNIEYNLSLFYRKNKLGEMFISYILCSLFIYWFICKYYYFFRSKTAEKLQQGKKCYMRNKLILLAYYEIYLFQEKEKNGENHSISKELKSQFHIFFQLLIEREIFFLFMGDRTRNLASLHIRHVPLPFVSFQHLQK